MHRHERPCGASCRFCARFLSRPPTAARLPRHIRRRTYRHAARRHTAHRHAREGGHPRVEPLLPCCLEGSCSMHPRSRGATLLAVVAIYAIKDLSPLTRGNRARDHLGAAARGPIPAHAGQPAARIVDADDVRAYPRSRGATGRFGAGADEDLGLSPLTRGNLDGGDRGARALGPIPAHAGQPLPTGPGSPAGRAYPRSRGATRPARWSTADHVGLSPLTRGNRDVSGPGRAAVGPIPAHAGQPSAGGSWCGAWRAYPRSRGATAARVERAAFG